MTRVRINGEWMAMGPVGYSAGQVLAGLAGMSALTLGHRVAVESDPDGVYVPGMAVYQIQSERY